MYAKTCTYKANSNEDRSKKFMVRQKKQISNIQDMQKMFEDFKMQPNKFLKKIEIKYIFLSLDI